MPVIAGFFLAYVFEPAVKAVHARWKVPRAVVTAFLLAIGVAACVGIVVWLLPLIINQGYALMENGPRYLNDVLSRILSRFGIGGEQALTGFQPDPMLLLRFLGGVIGTVTTAVFWIFLLPFFFFAFSWKFPDLSRRVQAFIPVTRREAGVRIIRLIDREWGSFFRARLFVGISSGFLMAFGWLFAGVPYWLLLGLLGGLLGIVPYLSVIAWVAALIFKYLSPAAGGTALLASVFFWPSLVFWVVHLFEEWVLIPWVQSYSVNLSPVTIILVIMIGGAVGGAGGLLFAIPVASALKILIQELAAPRFLSWGYALPAGQDLHV